MSDDPYRIPAKVISIIEPAPLFPNQVWSDDKRLMTAAGHKSGEYDVYCPKCRFNTLYLTSTTICTGKSTRDCCEEVQVLCPEHREHFHIRCSRCSFRGLMATADGKP